MQDGYDADYRIIKYITAADEVVDLVENTEMWEIQGAATYNERANVCQPCTNHKKDNVYTQYVVCSSLILATSYKH